MKNEEVRSVFLRKTDLTPMAVSANSSRAWARLYKERAAKLLLLLLFFFLPWVDAHGNRQRPGGWAGQGYPRHGWRG
ncbi:hypothetical protein MG068_16585 [Stenotrophomonas sp. ASS1]|nr:hypothetical protein MG068_16585 [Stenotrophomonas sp. ASS1]